MIALTSPLKTACATARVVRARSRAIADLAGQIAAYPDPGAVPSEEWVELSEALKTLLKELEDEIETFVQRASHAT
jgi:hypothetical protein